MAKIYPAKPDPDTPHSELKIFERLRDGLPESWLVLHACRVVNPRFSGRRAFEGEIDFLVLNPDWGWLGLEVKGGEIRATAAGWTSIDQTGTIHSIKDPGKQVQAAVHEIKKYLENHRLSRSWASTVSYGWGVVLPDLNVTGDLDPALQREFIVDRNDLQQPQLALDCVSHAWGKGRSISGEICQAWLNALVPTVQLVPALAHRIDSDQAALVRLTDEQMHVLDMCR